MDNKDLALKQLETINEVLAELDFNLEITIVGGSAFILNGSVSRATSDIDFINEVDKGVLDPVRAKLKTLGIDLNNRARIFRHNFRGWENEVIPFREYSNLKVNLLSNEMLVVSKFFTRTMDRDITEAAYNGIAVDQKKIEKLLKEIWENSNSITKNSLFDRQMEIIEFYRAKRWDYETSYIKDICSKKI